MIGTHKAMGHGSGTVARALLLLAAVAAVLLAGTAAARAALITDRYPLAGSDALALAGEATVVAEAPTRAKDLLRSFAAGRAARLLATPSSIGEGSNEELAVSASPTRSGLLQDGFVFGYKDCCAATNTRLLTGPLGGPQREPPSGCMWSSSLDDAMGREGSLLTNSVVAVEGELFVYDEWGCLLAEDPTSASQRVIPLQATLDPIYRRSEQRLPQTALLSLAGHLVAFRANPPGGEGPAAIAVYDLDTGTQLYRMPLPAFSPRALVTFGLQSDGTLVTAEDGSCSATVSTVAAPAPRPLGVAACTVAGTRGGRTLLIVPGPNRHRLLAWSPIEAPSVHVIADLGVAGSLSASAPVFSETDAAYALQGCFAASVYRVPFAAPGSPPPIPGACPVVAAPDSATPLGDGMRVRLRCPGGCTGMLSARIGRAGFLHHRGFRQFFASRDPQRFSAGVGGSFTVTLHPLEAGPVTAADRRGSSGERREIRLDLEILDPAGVLARSPERAQELGVGFEHHEALYFPIAKRR